MAENTEIIPQVEATVIANGNNAIINTMNNSTFEGKVAIVNAINNAISLNSVNDTLKICDCIAMRGVRKGRNGASDTECQNTYLIDVDGNAYFTQSDGIARSVQQYAAVFEDFGKSSEMGYLPIRVVSHELANGNTVKTLAIDL